MKTMKWMLPMGLLMIALNAGNHDLSAISWEEIQQTPTWKKFCGCAVEKPIDQVANREEALGSLEEGKLEELGTENYMEKLYLGVKRDFEYSGTEFKQVSDGLEAQGVALKRIEDDEKKLREILLSIDGDVSFPTGKSSLTPKAKELLGKIAAAMAAYPETKAKVGGHTDSVGAFQLNMRLSKARAVSVKEELMKAGSIAEERFTEVDGFADLQKIVNTISAEPRNRRTEITIGTIKIIK
ncbi:OmpA family protein [Leptospira sp. GIMC2001]|uniref:OmpA family protein n=1 Tax=Leptospira sp. GIMC2001 TaxID=1513297 RepID=UPI00234B8ECC|nr:OmpA family protein [Leptospira sp. GIMC2001]WCL48149.1 OmpA family protein [Leptospira sp. GIMC2001]